MYGIKLQNLEKEREFMLGAIENFSAKIYFALAKFAYNEPNDRNHETTNYNAFESVVINNTANDLVEQVRRPEQADVLTVFLQSTLPDQIRV